MGTTLTHGGDALLLGHDEACYSIWRRARLGAGPVRVYPATVHGWQQACQDLRLWDPAAGPLPLPLYSQLSAPAPRAHLPGADPFAGPGSADYGPPAGLWPLPPATNTPGRVGGIVGIVGAVLSLVPLIGIPIGLVMGIVAIVFAGIGLSRPGPASKSMATAGLVLGILTVVFKLIPGLNLL